MVYCGKPSKGCSNCRERKIRCDQKAPECGQCVKRHQACRGYRNITDLMFRDESSHVINKASKSRSRSNATKKNQSPDPNSPSPSPRPIPNSAPKSAATRSSTKPSTNSFARRRRPHGPVLAVLTPRIGSSPSQTSTDSNDGDLDNGESFLDEPSSNRVLAGDVLDASSQERGIDFFFSRYVTADNGYQNYSFIYDVWKPRDQDSAHAQVDAVTLSMAAVGLAIDAQLNHCTETMIRAYQSYGIALTLARTALRDPVDAIKDTTLLAVLILGTYEFVSGHSPQTMRAWQGHVNGAAILASMRGPNRFRNRASIQMFIMLSQSVLISCIQSELPMPQVMVDLGAELQTLLVAENPVWRVVDPIYRALQVRDDIKTGKLSNMDDIIAKLSHIDDEFTTILSELPPSWNYRRILLAGEDIRVFGRRCHVYPGLVQATTWNGVRAIRMLVLEAVLEQLYHSTGEPPNLASLPKHHRMRLAKTIRLLNMLGEAIVASVPQHFGVVSFRDGHLGPDIEANVTTPIEEQYRLKAPPAAPDIRAVPVLESQAEHGTSTSNLTNPDNQEGNAERFMTLASASNTIIWPLYVLGISSSCSPEMKEYAGSRLLAIHNETGLEQARIVARMLQAKEAPIALDLRHVDLPELPEGTLPQFV